MNKNKKIISLVCAIAMIFSMLSGLAITASAADDVITLTNINYTENNTKITLDLGYKGAPGLSSGEIRIVMPEGVTDVETDVEPDNTDIYTASNRTFHFKWAYKTKDIKAADVTEAKITTLTLTLASGQLEDATNIKVADGSYIWDGTDATTRQQWKVGAADDATNKVKGITASDVELPRNPSLPAKPTAKPTTDATPAPEATENPGTPSAPTVEPVKEASAGLIFGDITANAAKTEITVPLKYKDVPGLSSGEFRIVMPEGVTDVTTDVEPDNTDIYTASNRTFHFKWAYKTKDIKASDVTTDTIVTLTVKLDKALTEEAAIKYADGSYIWDGTDATTRQQWKVGAADDTTNKVKGIETSVAHLPANVETPDVPTPKVIGMSQAITVADVTDTVTSDAAGNKDAANNHKSDYFIDVEVKAGETDLTYDKDGGEDKFNVYIEGYNNNEPLTEAQYLNLINGNFDAANLAGITTGIDAPIKSINDVKNKLKFNTYNSNASVSAKLVNKATKEIENGDDKAATAEPPKVYSDPTISINDDTVAAGAAKTFTIPALTYSGNTYDLLASAGATYTITLVDGLAYVTGEGVTLTKADKTEVPLTKGTAVNVAAGETVSFTAAATAGDVTFKLDAAGKDPNGAARTATKTFKVSVVANNNNNTTNPGGGTVASSSGGGGAIASGYQGGTTTGLPGAASFTDLGDADWATEAVTMLAYQNIVSGYEDNTFRPNGNITRAEFAQILINAIGHNGDSADTYFDDVPTDAWFYHNVAVASQLGIVSGYGDGNFGPYDLITREQMALMTQKAAKVMNVNLSGADAGTFADDADIADWSKDAVYELANAGIINGMGDGTFAPKANATRAQASVIIYNTFVK